MLGFSCGGKDTALRILELDTLISGLGSKPFDGTEDGVRVP